MYVIRNTSNLGHVINESKVQARLISSVLGVNLDIAVHVFVKSGTGMTP